MRRLLPVVAASLLVCDALTGFRAVVADDPARGRAELR